MKISTLLFIYLMLLGSASYALDRSEIGEYGLATQNGYDKNALIRLSKDGNCWFIEASNGNGVWLPSTIKDKCDLRNATDDEVEKIFEGAMPEGLSATCILNAYISFCVATMVGYEKKAYYLRKVRKSKVKTIQLLKYR